MDGVEQKEIVYIGDDKKECTMCKFVFIFAFVVLLLVMCFVFFFRLTPGSSSAPLPEALAPLLSPAEQKQHIRELGAQFHPELATSSAKKTPTQGVPISQVIKTP